MTDKPITQNAVPFESASEFRNRHTGLLKQLVKLLEQDRSEEIQAAALAELEPQILQFLERGAATGAYLDEIEERTACQVLLDYWCSSLERAGKPVLAPPLLAQFDSEQLPILDEKDRPYVGLDAFQDKTYFFGRENGTCELLEQVRDIPLVVVGGASGSGKSSLVMGGILPVLQEKGATPKLLIVPPFFPGNTVLDNLVKAIRQVHPGTTDDVADEMALLRKDPMCLSAMVGGDQAPAALITIDQFEEVFTLSTPEDREALVANLAKYLEAGRGHRLILTVREEFKDQIVTLDALGSHLEKKSWYMMAPMKYEELKAAVEKPAAMANLQFQPGIVDDLVRKVVGQRAALPLLQFTLRELWKKRKRNRITWEVYNSVGDPLKALEKSADQFYEAQLRENRDEIKRILLELVRVDEMLEAYRQPVPKKELVEAGSRQTEEVLRLLADKDNDFVRIITGASDADAVVEVKHESLLRNWPKYKTWIDEKRTEQRKRTALADAAKGWEESGKPLEGLFTGWQLEEAKNIENLSGLEKEFIVASTAAIDRIQQEKEAALRREAEQAKDDERRLRLRLVFTVIAFLVTLGALTFAYYKKEEAAKAYMDLKDFKQQQITLKLQKTVKEAELKEERSKLETAMAYKQLETEEYRLTQGRIDEFIKIAPPFGTWEYTTYARNVFGSVATYLWGKKDNRSLDKLVNILKGSAEHIPEDYGVERLQGYVMPFVDEDAKWPLTVKYNPKRKFDSEQLLYQWRLMATNLAGMWGIPAPMRVKLKSDPSVGENDIVIIADTGQNDPKVKESELPSIIMNLVTKEGEVLVTLKDPEKKLQRLQPFIENHKKDWTDLKIAQGGPWFLVPKWTQPLWQVARRDCSPIEAAAAVLVANSLTEHPELVLTPECVQSILDRLKYSHPDTIKEVLSVRGGRKGITEDLVAIVKKGHSLNGLEYLLDALAKYPKLSSPEAAERAIEDQSRLAEQLPPRLPGIQTRAAATPSGQPSRRQPASEVRALDAPGGDEELLKSYPQAYEEANPWLSSIEPPIRVYLGKGLLNRFTTPKRELKPELVEAITGLREDIKKQFGITIPGVRFRDSEGDPQKKASSDSFRIEMFNQISTDADAQYIKATGDGAVEKFINELRMRCIAYRGWWVTAEMASEVRDNLPEYLQKWLGQRYTLTDLKLILKAVILPDENEQALYKAGLWKKAISEIPPEQTLSHPSWLLGSMVFGTNTTDPLNIKELSVYLRNTQHARLDPRQKKETEGRVVELIKTGIGQYNGEKIQLAKESFDAAVRLNRAAACRMFLSLYSQESQVRLVDNLRQIERLIYLPAPGKIATALKPSVEERNEMEEFLKNFRSQISPERLHAIQLCLLWGYTEDKSDKKVEELGGRFLDEWNLNDLFVNESYLLAYLMLKARGEHMAPPEHLHQIQELLYRAFKEFKDKEAEAAFDELSSPLYRQNFTTPIWYVSLLSSLTDIHPQSFWIPFQMGYYMAQGGYSQKELESAQGLLDRTQSNLKRVKLEDQERLQAWLDYVRAVMYRNLSSYKDPTKQKRDLDKALGLLTDLKKVCVEKEKGWPGLGSLYYDVSEIYLRMNKIDQATDEVERGIKKFPEDEDLQLQKCFLILTTGKVDKALKLARNRLGKLTKEDRAYPNWFYYATFLQVITGKGDFKNEARRYLNASSYDNQDYVRMMLYWALCKQHSEGEAKELLSERCSAIRPSDWPVRLEQGDKKVWAEMLLAYYAGKIGRGEVFGPLEDRRAFEKSNLKMIGETLPGFQCEYYFYDALLQEVSGDPADRQNRALKSLEKAVATQHLIYIEHHMARYLINQLRPQEQ